MTGPLLKGSNFPFIYWLCRFGTDFAAIAKFVGTRSSTQVRTHAQKYYAKLVWKKSPSWLLSTSCTTCGAVSYISCVACIQWQAAENLQSLRYPIALYHEIHLILHLSYHHPFHVLRSWQKTTFMSSIHMWCILRCIGSYRLETTSAQARQGQQAWKDGTTWKGCHQANCQLIIT